MKTISKKIAAGTMIAAFVLGVGAVNNYALAESASDATGSTSIQQSSPERNELGGKGRGGFGDKVWRHGNMIKTTATILNVDEASITASLKEGKTLAEIAEANGLSKEDYLQKIIAAETESINAEVTGGKVTQEQADKILSSLSERLTKQIEGTGLAGVHEGKRVGHGGMGFGNPEVLTQILGITQDDLRTEMEAGKSILDIATAKGISEDDLIGKIKDGMTDSIKKFVESKGGFQHKHPEGEASADETDSAAN